MFVLALDTSTPTLVCGVVEVSGGSVTTRAERRLAQCRQHNEVLVPTTQEVLAEAGLEFSGLDAVVVGEGPGPFTGLRVGMATGAAFGDALGIPVFGVCSLDAIATQINLPSALVATDARRREVYFAAYSNGQRLGEPQVMAPAQVTGTFDQVSVPEHLSEKLAAQGPRVDLTPTAASLVQVADLKATPRPLQPLYLRRPDAKEPKATPASPAIPDVRLD